MVEANKIGQVVIVLGPWGIRGAHFNRLGIDIDGITGQKVERLGPAEPIADDPTLREILGEATTVALAENGELKTQAEATQRMLADQETAINELRSELEAAKTRVEQAESQVADLQRQVDEMTPAQPMNSTEDQE